ncbi:MULTISPECIES: OmpA family protein [unclassified Nitratiruptor]|uniref:OmpA family protein n=1 Tax=unclassified Nitratiruptor TaxID=2624044 RepID=UPI0019165BA6|nr:MULTISPECIES: OmpA family protein [unclassified Nitratiruptor]BCD60063.1 peptidoglycan-associated lipoprotein [Nitratiruptor sp. YY08-10]BCD64448.1 peptidoglycan-associated lipoprotein [Nitratiruptor sp. YY08-14]
MKARDILTSAVIIGFLISGCAKKVEVEAPQTQATEQQEATEVTEGSGIQTIGNDQEMMEEAKLRKMKAIEAQSKKIYFDFDKYNIRPDQQPRVEFDAKLFNSEEAKPFNIKVEGNCDEWGTDEYNYALGLKRAKSVRDALAARGVAKDRMTLISYGESNPVCTEHTKECWAKNRRVEFELIP